MRTSKTKQSNCNNNSEEFNEEKKNKYDKNTQYGLENYKLCFCLIFCIHLAVDNYISFGIKADLITMTTQLINFLKAKWWVFAICYIAYLIQLLLAVTIEKLLSKSSVTERVGMTLHAVNWLSLLNFCTVLFTVIHFNPFAGQFILAHALLACFKLWSYIMENRKYRKQAFAKQLKENGASTDEVKNKEKLIKYPENLTFKNLYKYMTTESNFYNLNKPNLERKRNLKMALITIIRFIFILYAVAFIILQYLIPELDVAMLSLARKEYFKIVSSVIKLIIPTYLIWYLFYFVYVFKVYNQMISSLWGTESLVFYEDWHNAESVRIFWIKWNVQIHIWFKEYFYKPLLRKGYGKAVAVLVVALITGLLHEYVGAVSFRNFNGIATFLMSAQIPAGVFTELIYRKFGAKWGNFSFVFSHLLSNPLCAIFVYYNYLKYEYGTVV